MKRVLFCIFAMVIMGSAHAYTVSYDCGTSNGTVPTDSTNYTSGDTVTVKPNTCTVPSGKHFAGYVCGSTNVAAGNKFTITENTTCTAQYENGKFAVKTTSLAANSTFIFQMTAAGTFTVDCGDGGVLTSNADPTDITNGNTITRSDTTAYTAYTCTWASAGAHTITFDGTGTGYASAETVPDNERAAIFFRGNAYIASISGDLSALFPFVGTNDDQMPNFHDTFKIVPNLTQIPNTLFTGYTTARRWMFYSTFMSSGLTSIPSGLFANFTTGASDMFYTTFRTCASLTTIPADLFGNFTVGTYQMFSKTFSGCTSLTTIPSGLFSSFTTGANYMFHQTFEGCTALTTIPSDLFENMHAGQSYMFSNTFSGCTALTTIPNGLFASFTSGGTYMFFLTFAGCNHLTTIPADLFENIHIGQQYMFGSTFQGCSALTSIPSGLFSHFTTGAPHLFHATFSACSSLSALPSGLFSGFTSGASHMFYYTFNVCSGLRGYVPADFFGGLIANNAAYQTDMMTYVFYGTDLATSCDSYNGTIRYVTPYDEYWSSKVSCGAPINCTAGQYLPARTTTCATCSENNYCASAGSYGMNTTDQGLTACSTVGDNSYTASDAGATTDTQCYKTCTISHATTMTGHDYYGAGVDTCVATACENGYSVSSDICTGNIVTINWNGATAAAIAANNAGTAVYGGDIRTPQSYDPSQVPAGKRFVGWKFRKPVQN